MNRRAAFTLIELLVVIAIIAIMAAILFPVFAQAKNSAKQTKCVANMKQIGLAQLMYAGDYDDTWAPCATETDAGSNFNRQQIWIGYDNNNTYGGGGFFGDVTKPAKNPDRPGALSPYIKNDDIKRCPQMPEDFQSATAYNYWYSSGFSSYYYQNPKARNNEFGPGAKTTGYSNSGFVITIAAKSSEIDEPAYTISTWEHKAWVPMCNFLLSPSWFDRPPNGNSYRQHFNALHRGGSTAVWCDGHTKRYTYDQLKRPMFSCRKDIYEP